MTDPKEEDKEYYTDPTTQEEELSLHDYPFGPIPHWIKCSERLPQEGKRVLVFSDYVQCKIYEKEYGFYDGTTHCYCPEGRLDKVTHWMPLPGPPNE